MRNELGELRLTQLERGLESFRTVRGVSRPQRGWIHAVREAKGISSGELGRILGVSRQLPLQFEKAEAEDSITLKSLRNVANALDCDLVYALVPRVETKQKPAEKHGSTQARKPHRKAVERIDTAAETKAFDDETENSYFCD